MNLSERNKLIEHIFQTECLPILQSKGHDYCNDDAYDQFMECASDISSTVECVIFTYMSKHWKALQKSIRGKRLSGEPIDEKLKDIINYCAILLVWLREQNRTSELIEGFVPDEDNVDDFNSGMQYQNWKK